MQYTALKLLLLASVLVTSNLFAQAPQGPLDPHVITRYSDTHARYFTGIGYSLPGKTLKATGAIEAFSNFQTRSNPIDELTRAIGVTTFSLSDTRKIHLYTIRSGLSTRMALALPTRNQRVRFISIPVSQEVLDQGDEVQFEITLGTNGIVRAGSFKISFADDAANEFEYPFLHQGKETLTGFEVKTWVTINSADALVLNQESGAEAQGSYAVAVDEVFLGQTDVGVSPCADPNNQPAGYFVSNGDTFVTNPDLLIADEELQGPLAEGDDESIVLQSTSCQGSLSIFSGYSLFDD